MKITHPATCQGGTFSCGHLALIILRSRGADQCSPMAEPSSDPSNHLGDSDCVPGAECSGADVLPTRGS